MSIKRLTKDELATYLIGKAVRASLTKEGPSTLGLNLILDIANTELTDDEYAAIVDTTGWITSADAAELEAPPFAEPGVPEPGGRRPPSFSNYFLWAQIADFLSLIYAPKLALISKLERLLVIEVNDGKSIFNSVYRLRHETDHTTGNCFNCVTLR